VSFGWTGGPFWPQPSRAFFLPMAVLASCAVGARGTPLELKEEFPGGSAMLKLGLRGIARTSKTRPVSTSFDVPTVPQKW